MKFLVIDGNSVFNRAFYGIKLLSTSEGIFTNAIYGFLNILFSISDEVKPDATAITFDVKAPTFRHEYYSEYKATRKGMPPELAMQLPILKELLVDLGYTLAEKSGFEADDLIGTFSKTCTDKGYECVIATGDKDSLQLVNENVTVRLTATFAGRTSSTAFTPDTFREKYCTDPIGLIDIKALMGDSSDNVPGVAGIGEKTACALISKYGNIEYIYDHLDEIEATQSVKNKLAAGKDSAFMSKYLVTIKKDVDFDSDPANYRRKPINRPAAYKTFMKLEMPTMIQKLNLWDAMDEAQEPASQANTEAKEYTAKELVNPAEPRAEKELFVHVEYDGEDPECVIFIGEKKVWYIEKTNPDFLEIIQKVFTGLQSKLITSDCKKLYKFTLKNGIKIPRPEFDILLSCYICDPSETDYSLKKTMLKFPTEKTKLVGDVVENSVENVKNSLVLPSLYNSLSAEIDKNGQKELLGEVEIPLSEVLSDMELCGFLIDREGLENFGEELSERIVKIQKEIFEICGEEFNLNSPKQLGDILFVKLGLPHAKKTKSGYSTNAEVLESLRGYHPVVDMILEYRKLSKLNSTYVEGLLKAIAEDGRIHTTFNQTETRTGRISSLEPNLQNIPVRTQEGSRLREFFLAQEGKVLVDADYSQIELRVLAHVANDKHMLDAFENGVDIHTLTASQVFGVPLDFVTPQMRSRAKAVNFGIVYGIGAFSLSKDIGVSVKEAGGYINSYLENFSGVDRYMKTTIEDGKEKGYVSTMFNRRRYMPELRSSNRMIVAAGERIAMNMPIQGTAADIIKIAMVRVYDRLKNDGLKSKLIMQVHDELIIEAYEDEREQVQKLLAEEMENAVSLRVRLRADTSSGKNWLEAK